MITRFCFKKYFFLFFLTISCIANAQKKFTIVLDPGHGGSDTGANRNYDFGYAMEKDITLGIVLKLGKMLEKNKDFKVIYTRTSDVFPSLSDRTTLANRSKADLFVSIHVNASKSTSSTAQGTETFVQGPDQNNTNLEVAKRENDVIYLDEKDKEIFASYDPRSPESLIALKIQQSKYLEKSLLLGSFVEENFTKSGRYSRGVKQANLHVLRMNAMPSVLIETGFVNNYSDAVFLNSEKGQAETAKLIYDAITKYVQRASFQSSYVDTKPEKPEEVAMKNDYRIQLMSTRVKYNDGDPIFRGLKYILTIKDKGLYKYYYAVTNFASIRDSNLKTAKDAGFKNAFAVPFVPNQALYNGYYTIEVAVNQNKLAANSYILKTLNDVERTKDSGLYYYTYGNVKTLEEAVKLQKEISEKGITNTVIQKVTK